VYAYSSPERLDLAAIEVPDEFWCVLGVKAASASGNYPENSSVTLYGWDANVASSSVGPAKEASDLLGLDYWASSIEGWSGTPLFNQGKVVGVHRGHRVNSDANHGVMIHPFIGGAETPHRGSAWRQVTDYDDDWTEDSIIAKGRKLRIKHSLGRVAVVESDWVPRDGRYWSDIVDDESYDGMESKLGGGVTTRTGEKIDRHDSVQDKAMAERHESVFKRDKPAGPVSPRFEQRFGAVGLSQTFPPPAKPKPTGSADWDMSQISTGPGAPDGDAKQGNAMGSSQTGELRAQPQKEATSGLTPLGVASKDGTSVDLPPPSSLPSPRRDQSRPRSDSVGRRGGRQRRKKASPGSPRKRDSPSAQNISSSLKALQKRVDGVRPALSKLPISSETAAASSSLLKDLLGFAMRLDARRPST
jgi:hypothetical protein